MGRFMSEADNALEASVEIGSRWRFPDGEIVVVGAFISDAYERTVLCTSSAPNSVLHYPALTLAKTAERVPTSAGREGKER